MSKNTHIHYYLFRSRNKDNKGLINDYKERSKVFLLADNGFETPDYSLVEQAYAKFVSEGVPGEKTRSYTAVNTRNAEKIKKQLIAKLAIENPDITDMQKVVNSVAMKPECANESYWLIDFDSTDVDLLKCFVRKVNSLDSLSERYFVTRIQTTPHGYAIVTEHGFDVRPLKVSFPDLDYTIMRDNLIFCDMRSTEHADSSEHEYRIYEPFPDGEFEWCNIRSERQTLM